MGWIGAVGACGIAIASSAIRGKTATLWPLGVAYAECGCSMVSLRSRSVFSLLLTGLLAGIGGRDGFWG